MVQKEIETDEQFAKRAGYQVILTDFGGWVVISPREKIDVSRLAEKPDSRQRHHTSAYAWEVAAIRARRAGKK